MPYFPGDIESNHPSQFSDFRVYPVEMGLSDVVILETDEGFSMFSEYAPLNLNWTIIYENYKNGSGSSVKFTALPACTSFKSCSSCVNYSLSNKDKPGNLKCGWCPQSRICADIIGREANSLDEQCLIEKGMLLSEEQCVRIELASRSKLDAVLPYIIVTTVVFLLLIISLICITRRLNKVTDLLRKYESGVPDEANDSGSIPGLPDGKATFGTDDEKEMEECSV